MYNGISYPTKGVEPGGTSWLNQELNRGQPQVPPPLTDQ